MYEPTRPDPQGGEAVLDELLSALADATRRAVVEHFRHTGRRVATTAELADELARDATAVERDRLDATLHHTALPKLDAAGVLAYDPASRTARYRGEELSEPVRRLVASLETVATV
ncbi:DUF7344 domain-containing protein [Halobaculum lipolyticum]|uniref:DUF7344 domain-containing protein n=1 Tax=Halobaculum lipolyticum TaxID=3032001 RepID=A0ABD5WJT7_9EURY|nr:hypothetical protein [Halobaculum sp. DT31]